VTREARKGEIERKHETFFVFSRSFAISWPTTLILYLVLTIAMTWPLAAGLTRDVPGDLGDSLLNMWILGWMAEGVPRVLSGEMSLGELWNANIFHPEPLALAFSEHLFGQALQILPVYHLTHNLILAYNLLFLSTFALSGFAMYLLVRDITGNRSAAFVAGLIYAFVPYRLAQLAHIQSLSSQWMPFALYGFYRHIKTGRGKPLIGGTAALLMQNWSCGYYLIYFTPFVVLFVIHQIFAAGRAREWKAWVAFAVAALVVAAGTWPFLTLYLDAQRLYGFKREISEVVAYSADVYGYLTASDLLKLWGPIVQMAPKPEGEVFLGFLPAALAVIALVYTARLPRDESTPWLFWIAGKSFRRLSIRRAAIVILSGVALTFVAGLVAIVFTGGFVTSIGSIPVRANNAPRLFWQLAGTLTALAIVSRHFRRATMTFLRSPAGLAAMSLVLAAWMSLGPVPHSRGTPIAGIGLYGFFYDYVPGFDALRVPARYAMIAAVYLSMLAGIGAASLMAHRARATVLAAVLSVAFLAEAFFAPMFVNQTWGEGAVIPAPRIEPAASAPAVYRHLATMPGDLVIAEFPFGDPAWELRYVYYSTVHWKRIVNGYSGGFPQAYKVRVARFERIALEPEQAWHTLIEAGATHVVLHEGAVTNDQLTSLRLWLQTHGATELGRFDNDSLFAIR
jgi:hypothetical protein